MPESLTLTLAFLPPPTPSPVSPCLNACLMPECLPACLNAACLYVCLPACLAACLPARLSDCLSACLSLCLPATGVRSEPPHQQLLHRPHNSVCQVPPRGRGEGNEHVEQQEEGQ